MSALRPCVHVRVKWRHPSCEAWAWRHPRHPQTPPCAAACCSTAVAWPACCGTSHSACAPAAPAALMCAGSSGRPVLACAGCLGQKKGQKTLSTLTPAARACTRALPSQPAFRNTQAGASCVVRRSPCVSLPQRPQPQPHARPPAPCMLPAARMHAHPHALQHTPCPLQGGWLAARRAAAWPGSAPRHQAPPSSLRAQPEAHPA